MVGYNRESVVAGRDSGPASGEENPAGFQRGIALQVQRGVGVISQATGAQLRHAVAANVIAAEVIELRGSGDMQVRRRSSELRAAVQFSAPAPVASHQQAGELS